MANYKGFIPPCGVYCGKCYKYMRTKNPCHGASVDCRKENCKSYYVCAIVKHGVDYCYQCTVYPCAKYKKFAQSWLQYGQDMLKNQQDIKKLGEEAWLKQWHTD